MGNLKKPFFWGYMFIEIYWIGFSLSGMVWLPSLIVKVVCGISVVLFCYYFVVALHRPVSDKSFVGITLMIIGSIYIVGGKLLLDELINPPQLLNYYDYERWFEVFPVLAETMFLCGVMIVLFSILGLISNTISKKLVRDSSPHLNS